ncbi:ubiquinone biosynthesis UbiH/UbiF/VisC/COQ6 family hydroxylase [Pseudoduganella lurida]|uniref:Ubiquinone biosynthesis UbiH/UbiF/VisC/COQ6 family hydroxylase n=1 Tax=Pseudoduganella lurida TaxID=1036180 RepID=A0A562QVU5_9BURK|nr:FAD-dependent monooxygenase [Pseudoduganella lurida]TWI60887.1 ubiquinone biosynthesis UbiH/UbiF/VisC/COQ6 family hydroxylase [Pseudoduganella lurida]
MNQPTSTKHHVQTAVCIVGNGAIAKAAALAFAQAGQSVTLLGPPPAPKGEGPEASWDVRVYALNSTAHELLSGLKVWGAMDQERIAPVDAMVIKGDGEQPGHLNFDAYGAHTSTLAWIVEDRNLNGALDAALRFAQNVHLVTGRAVRLDANEAGATVHLEDGSAIKASLVVGADGANSWVRSQSDIGLDYKPYGQKGVVANFETELPHHGAALQWFTCTRGIVALLPLAGNRVSLVWSAPDMLADQLCAEGAQALADRLAEFAAEKLGKLTPVQPELVRAFPLSLMRPHALVAQRVALVGDAAHVVHPLAGHGMNLGFGDVRDLVAAVAGREEHRSIGDDRVLARYARTRKEEVLLMQATTDGLQRLFGANLEPVRAVRNFGLNLLDKLPMVKRQLMAHALGRH